MNGGKTEPLNPLLLVGLSVAGAGLVALAIQRTKRTIMTAAFPFEPVLNPMIIRVDKGGSGYFGSGRIGHKHQGTDFVCQPGQQLYAPFAGIIVREAKPYADDPRWSGLVLRSDDGNYECKLFYCVLAEDVGAHVERGQLVAFAQRISAKYNTGVTDHIHIEVRQDGDVLNPENLWQWTASTGTTV